MGESEVALGGGEGGGVGGGGGGGRPRGGSGVDGEVVLRWVGGGWWGVAGRVAGASALLASKISANASSKRRVVPRAWR